MSILGDIAAMLKLTDDVLLGRRRQQRDKEVEFLEAVVKDAREVADAWTGVLKSIESTGTADDSFLHGIAFKTGRIPNSLSYARLTAFYKVTSRALGPGVSAERRESIFDALGTLMREREITKDEYLNAVRRARPSLVTITSDNSSVDWSRLSECVSGLQREAAALEALVAEFRAGRRS